MVTSDYVAFMCDLEKRYKKVSGLADRSYYKIFYGPIRPAQILVLGINPGEDPSNTEADGMKHKTGEIAAASASFYENGECDLLDCDRRENRGLKKLLLPLLDGNEEAIRHSVVKSNMAFRRSSKKKDIDIEAAKREAAPFLLEILSAVRPRLVMLTGVQLTDFLERFCSEHSNITPPIKDDKVKHVVFQSANAQIFNCNLTCLVVQVDHASQFSWTYDKYNVVERIKSALAPQDTTL